MALSKTILMAFAAASAFVGLILYGSGVFETNDKSQLNDDVSRQSDGAQLTKPHPDALAQFQWAMNCQGCHGPKGKGNASRDVPPLVELNAFQKISEGREFLVRVPGVSRSPLNNSDLTDLMNWMVREMDPNFSEKEQILFTEQEVGRLRQKPLLDEIRKTRSDIIKSIN